MRLKKIAYELNGTTDSLHFTDRELQNDNHITVISGENGTGKSALLRAMSDASLDRTVSRQSHSVFTNVDATFVHGHPSQTIALSGTVNDRFPVNNSGNIRSSMRSFDLEDFMYFGPKFSGGIASSERTSANIARALVSSSKQSWAFGAELAHLMEYLKLSSVVRVSLEVNKSFTRKWPEYPLRLIDSINRVAHKKKSLPKQFNNTLSVLGQLSEMSELPVNNNPARSPNTLSVNVSTGEIEGSLGVYRDFFGPQVFDSLGDEATLAILISTRMVIADVEFQSLSSESFISVQRMSSGQWQLINCLFNLCVYLRNNTLVLIDEPENSLHPQWQRDYISLIRKLTAHKRGCHIFIATHSPLIMSSLLPHEGNIVRLARRELGSSLQAYPEQSSYGWLPGDILRERFEIHSERPPEFAKAVDAALRIMRRPGENLNELRTVARRLERMREELPRYDPIHNVLNVIIDTAKRGKSASLKAVD